MIIFIKKPEKIDYLRSNILIPRSSKDLTNEVNHVCERLIEKKNLKNK